MDKRGSPGYLIWNCSMTNFGDLYVLEIEARTPRANCL